MANSNASQVATFLDSLVAKNQTPGVQYVVLKNDEISFEHAAGVAEFEDGRPITKQTSFNACSVTKTFTSLAIMQLVENGKIKISDDASAYLDPYPFPEEITIQQFLSHTSGLSNPIPLRWAHLHEEDASFNSDEFVSAVLSAHSKLKHRPGDHFAYSNLNYLVLGKVVEKVSGMDYRAYVHRHIISKLLLNNMPLQFLVTTDSNYARGYQKKLTAINAILGFFLDRKKFTEPASNKKWFKFRKYYVNGTAYGGLIANAYSLSAFIKTLFQPGSILLSDEFKRMLLTKQKLHNGKMIEMTLGWFTGRLDDANYFTHAGGGGGYYCEMRKYPEKNLITSIMFNRTGINDERFLDKVDRFFL